ncbi:unnamed protein product [Calypogeia fissa]
MIVAVNVPGSDCKVEAPSVTTGGRYIMSPSEKCGTGLELLIHSAGVQQFECVSEVLSRAVDDTEAKTRGRKKSPEGESGWSWFCSEQGYRSGGIDQKTLTTILRRLPLSLRSAIEKLSGSRVD